MCLRRVNSGEQPRTGPKSQYSEANPENKVEMDLRSTNQSGGGNMSDTDQKKKLVQHPSAQKISLPPLSVNSSRQNQSAEKGQGPKTTTN